MCSQSPDGLAELAVFSGDSLTTLEVTGGYVRASGPCHWFTQDVCNELVSLGSTSSPSTQQTKGVEALLISTLASSDLLQHFPRSILQHSTRKQHKSDICFLILGMINDISHQV
jgi:hypothetical protein